MAAKGSYAKVDKDAEAKERSTRAIAVENDALRRELSDRTGLLIQQKQQADASKSEASALQKSLARTREDLDDIVVAIQRSHDNEKETLQQTVARLKSEVERLRGDLDNTASGIAALQERHEAELTAREAVADGLRHRMEQMSDEFGDMLAQTLAKMREKVDLSQISSGKRGTTTNTDERPAVVSFQASSSSSSSSSNTAPYYGTERRESIGEGGDGSVGGSGGGGAFSERLVEVAAQQMAVIKQ